ncbi:hypothetical protein FOCC_FOCC012175 [Frankliniella occidentalis]|nr:hypothetical protein FOCC_FOCC012175 [Frankliniella occidentalis]
MQMARTAPGIKVELAMLRRVPDTETMAASSTESFGAPPSGLGCFNGGLLKPAQDKFGWATEVMATASTEGFWEDDPEEQVKKKVLELKTKFHMGRQLQIKHLPRDVTEELSKVECAGQLLVALAVRAVRLGGVGPHFERLQEREPRGVDGVERLVMPHGGQGQVEQARARAPDARQVHLGEVEALEAAHVKAYLVQGLVGQPGVADADGRGEGAHFNCRVDEVEADELDAGGEGAQLEHVRRSDGLFGQPHPGRREQASLEGAVPLVHHVHGLEDVVEVKVGKRTRKNRNKKLKEERLIERGWEVKRLVSSPGIVDEGMNRSMEKVEEMARDGITDGRES